MDVVSLDLTILLPSKLSLLLLPPTRNTREGKEWKEKEKGKGMHFVGLIASDRRGDRKKEEAEKQRDSTCGKRMEKKRGVKKEGEGRKDCLIAAGFGRKEIVDFTRV